MPRLLLMVGLGGLLSLLTAYATADCGTMNSPEAFLCEAKEELRRAKRVTQNRAIAKNVVIFVGDGMGVPTVTAGRIYQGQQKGMTGEENVLFFEKFPYLGLSKTYNPDRQVADSAGTASAMFSGVKANYGTLGVNNRVPYGKSCDQMSEANNLKTVVDHGLAEGKSVGIVTTARITHATPAASYCHVAYRSWESDTDMGIIPGCEKVKDIALQLIEDNPDIQVILGGGRRAFLNNTTPDPQTGEINSHQRTDGRDLIEEWKMDKVKRGKSFQYVANKGQFDSVDAKSTDFLFGLFQVGHMTYETDRDSSPNGEPSLTEMVVKALDILMKNPKGFVLIAEGARIDHAHHKNEAKRALVELVSLDKAVQTAQSKTGSDDTLTIVTADHSHVFSMAGYPTRGNDILGVVDKMEEGEAPKDGLPYATLVYANGPEVGRTNLTEVNMTGNTFRYPSYIEMDWETHGGEDVAIYAKGPMSHLFHATHEQHYIGHVMMYAACMGEYSHNEDCDRSTREKSVGDHGTCGASSLPMATTMGSLVVVGSILLKMWLV